MKKLCLVIILALVTTGLANAQFPSSQTVYIYEYDHTYDDGIISKSSSLKGEIYFVNIQNDILGYTKADKDYVKRKLIDSPDYFNEEATNMVASDYKKSKIQENNNSVCGPNPMYSYWISIYRYNKEYSTSSKYTYRKYAILHNQYVTPFGMVDRYFDWEWDDSAYSFSSDRSEMLIWSINNPGSRHYYKRIYLSDLKTNLDFLN